MALPDRPDPDDIVASNWGQWVQDRLTTSAPMVVAVRTAATSDQFGDCYFTKPAEIGTVLAAFAQPQYDPNGILGMRRNNDLTWKLYSMITGEPLANWGFGLDLVVVGTAALDG